MSEKRLIVSKGKTAKPTRNKVKSKIADEDQRWADARNR